MEDIQNWHDELVKAKEETKKRPKEWKAFACKFEDYEKAIREAESNLSPEDAKLSIEAILRYARNYGVK